MTAADVSQRWTTLGVFWGEKAGRDHVKEPFFSFFEISAKIRSVMLNHQRFVCGHSVVP